MKAAVLYGKNDIRIEEREVPSAGEGEVLLRVGSAFVCGSDVRVCGSGALKTADGGPLVLGHEMSGTIAEIGAGVTAIKKGMRVAVAPNMGCGHCRLCISGNSHLCADYRAVGIHMDGSFAEYVRIPRAAVEQGNVIEIPDALSFEAAALVEPLSCVYNGFERCAIRPNDSVLTFGAGPIGIMHGMLARMAGASPVMFSDLSEERLARVKSMMPDIITLSSEGVLDVVMDITGGRGLDVSITACPAPQVQALALELAAINGRVLFFGGLPADKAQVPLNTNLIHYRQIVVTGTTRASLDQYCRSLDLVAKGLVDLDPLVTSRCSIDDLPVMLSGAGSGAELKVLVEFGE